MSTHSIILDSELEARLESLCQRMGMSATEVIHRGLESFLSERPELPSLYDLGGDLFGADVSPQEDVSAQYRRLLKERLDAKYPR